MLSMNDSINSGRGVVAHGPKSNGTKTEKATHKEENQREGAHVQLDGVNTVGTLQSYC